MSKCKRQYKSVITKRIWQSVRKLSVVLLMVACATSVLTVGGTNAGFSDLEESQDNTWMATSLDARATYIEYFSVVGMNPSQQPDSRITFSNEGGLDFRYRVRYQKTGGDDTLCQAFSLTAERSGVTVYTGPLEDFDKADFSGTPFEIPSFGSDDWDFTVTLPADAGSSLENLSCQWQFDFTAWQTNVPDATSGFSDAESVGPHTIATGEWLTPGDVVINEVMWMGSTVSDSDEWIELKNMTGNTISLAGWQLEKSGTSGGTLTISSGKSIPANGYFLIANYGKSSGSSALDVEADWVTTSVAFNNTGNGNIVLKAPSAVVIDSALGTPNWGAGNHGTLEQSMERNDIPGDGLLASSWHACVSGAANGAPYWDAVGNNFGTPKAANLSPIVLNEFMFNPIGADDADRPEGEWV
ncbi:MAG: lamin tail domain-containing protein, partial [Candidatus Moranbacteria bacterium]|nr:lamin tail domain-containing protein [Candidatus Moranbacteria bacterium]